MFASGFIVEDDSLKHERGRENLSVFTQSKTIESGKNMSNHFCKTCGTLMYRVSEIVPNRSLLRIGTVDDFTLMDTILKPQVEIYTKDKASWVTVVAASSAPGAIAVPETQGEVV